MKYIWLVEWLKWCGIYLAVTSDALLAKAVTASTASTLHWFTHFERFTTTPVSCVEHCTFSPWSCKRGRTPFPPPTGRFFFFLPLSSQDGWERGSFRHHDGASSAGSSVRTGDKLFHRDGWRVPFFFLLLLYSPAVSPQYAERRSALIKEQQRQPCFPVADPNYTWTSTGRLLLCICYVFLCLLHLLGWRTVVVVVGGAGDRWGIFSAICTEQRRWRRKRRH